MIKFICGCCKSVNHIAEAGEKADEQFGVESFNVIGPGTLTWCRTCGVVQKLSVVEHLLPDCPACAAKRLHSVDEFKKFHPDSGKGFDNIGTKPLRGKEHA